MASCGGMAKGTRYSIYLGGQVTEHRRSVFQEAHGKHLMTDGFESDVQTWIIRAIQRGVSSFEELIKALPGVYPAVALDALLESRRR